MATVVSGEQISQVYAKGDTCLMINPYDSYHLFTVYNDWKSSNPTPLDLAEGNQSLYLVFKSKSKEVKIPEFTRTRKLTLDKSQGQVLFKISKENANIILSLPVDTFYITRVYEIYDADGNLVSKSDEEVIYVGSWADEKTFSTKSLSAENDSLKKALADISKQLNNYAKMEATWLASEAEYIKRIDELQSENSSLNSKLTELESQLSNYISGMEYDGSILSTNAVYVYDNADNDMTENELKKIIERNQNLF